MMDFKALRGEIQKFGLDPEKGLPEELFLLVSSLTPLINVDLLVRDDQGRVLLTWRDDEFYASGWHVPGGIIRFREDMSDRIAAVARLELGTKVSHDPEPFAIHEVKDYKRRERGHFISMLFECRLLAPPRSGLAYTGGKPRAGQWAWHEKFPEDMIEVHHFYRQYIDR